MSDLSADAHPNNAPPTKKDLWFAAYIASLHRRTPDEALADADRALELCDERWSRSAHVPCWNYKFQYPVGHTFNLPPSEQTIFKAQP